MSHYRTVSYRQEAVTGYQYHRPLSRILFRLRQGREELQARRWARQWMLQASNHVWCDISHAAAEPAADDDGISFPRFKIVDPETISPISMVAVASESSDVDAFPGSNAGKKILELLGIPVRCCRVGSSTSTASASMQATLLLRRSVTYRLSTILHPAPPNPIATIRIALTYKTA